MSNIILVEIFSIIEIGEAGKEDYKDIFI